MDIELGTFEKRNGNDSTRDQVTAGNGAGANHRTAAEAVPLLKQFPETSKEACASGDTAEDQSYTARTSDNTTTNNQMSSVCRIKKELNDEVCKKVKLWMVLIGLIFLIFIVIGISLLLCSVIHDDVDEKYDRSSFGIPRYFNGSFQIINHNFTEELLSLSSNESHTLSTELEQKLSDLYASSPALGRYFSKAEIYAFRNGSAIALYRLMFLMPEDHAQLKRFTLSREVVYSVFRQFLYDQETDIDPASLEMNERLFQMSEV